MSKTSRRELESTEKDLRRLLRLVLALARLLAVLVLLVTIVVVQKPELIMAVVQLLATLGVLHGGPPAAR